MGADEYLTKLFGTRELLARIKALARHVKFDTAHMKCLLTVEEIWRSSNISDNRPPIELFTNLARLK